MRAQGLNCSSPMPPIRPGSPNHQAQDTHEAADSRQHRDRHRGVLRLIRCADNTRDAAHHGQANQAAQNAERAENDVENSEYLYVLRHMTLPFARSLRHYYTEKTRASSIAVHLRQTEPRREESVR